MLKESEKNKLEEMLEDMNDVQLLVMYHASLKALLKKGINPLEEQ